jgi:amino acid adenylation domain-containing protein/non-ribosomal peptide synthase protein (TIGR01720 family)
MSSTVTRFAALSDDKRRLLLEKLRAKNAPARIQPAGPGNGPAPLSWAQQRLWFLQQIDPSSAQYNLPAAARVLGPLDTAILERCFAAIIRRHEPLRTTFTTIAGEPVQIVAPPSAFTLPVCDVTGEDAIAERVRAAAAAAFDLAQGPLFRAEVLRIGAHEHLLLLNAHHIISDSWSAGILVRELLALYEAFSDGSRPSLPMPPVRYVDYACWQRDAAQENAIEAHLDYWRGRLSGALPVLELPLDHPRPAVPAFRGALRKRPLPDSLSRELQLLSPRAGVTPFMTLLSAFKVLLSRYTTQQDVIVGSPVAGRERIETNDLMGCFVNTLALRTDCSGDPSFADLLKRVQQTCLDAYAHQEAPFERVVEAVQPSRDLSRTPIFQVAFGLRQDPVREYAMGQVRFELLETHTGMTKFDLMLEVIEAGGRLTAAVEYNSDLFEPASIDRLLGHYEVLLSAAIAAPETPVSLLPLMTRAEAEEIGTWNQTEKAYPLHRCLHEFIEDQVDRTPDAIAVKFEDETVTYRELENRANRLAHFLRKAGVGPDALAGVAMERSIEMVVSLIAVLKAGGAYVPIDPEYPADRIAQMLEDAQPSVLLTQSRLTGQLPPCAASVVAVDRLSGQIDRGSDQRPVLNVSPGNLAYVIFTSGSTGRPKGAMNSHRGIVNRLCWMQDEYQLDATDRVLQKTPFSFDVSVWEFFWPLMTGATLVVARPGGHRDSAYLASLIVRESITTLHFVPSMLQIFLDEPRIAGCRTVRRVICSGEALPYELQQRFFARMNAELHNLYGPTEAAVDVTNWKCEANNALRTVPIGRPIANTQIHLLDARMNAVPVGIPGELYIGGVNVGLGYLNRPELSAEKFIADPFRPAPDARLYRTGDLARYLPGGAIDYLGRIDHQVKIRGFRIELGEIETVLNGHPFVHESVVIAVTHGAAGKRLAAYVVPSGTEPVAVETLREHLHASLPEYMIPATFTVLERLPLSPNGKVDRRALPAPDMAADTGGSREYAAPRTTTEELLAELWSGALGVERVGRHDDFFQMGGHSLLAAQLASRVRTALGVELPVRRIFEHPTLEALAAAIDAGNRHCAVPAVTRRAAREGAPLSFAQQRLWILDQLTPSHPVYHLPLALKIHGALNENALARSLEYVIDRHESLRTRFPVRNGAPVQVVDTESRAGMEVRDLSELPAEDREAELRRVLLEHVRQPFDLTQGPLIRVLLVRLGEQEHALSLVMHHIVSDGWSLTLLLREMSGAYAAYVGGSSPGFAELPIHYADYALWQREWLEGAVFDSQMGYWRRQLESVPALNLPTDRPRPRVQTFEGARRSARFSEELSDRLRRLGRDRNATPFMVLFAGFNALLARYTGQTDIAAGTPVANRNRSEFEGLIGFLVNTLVLRTRLDGDPSFTEILSRVREVCLGAYANQDLPFERLVEELRPDRHLGANPLFQAAFTVRDANATKIEIPGAVASIIDPPDGISKFDLTMEIETGDAGLRVAIEYDTVLFDAETIESLLGNFEMLLSGAAENPNTPLSRLPLLNERDRQRMLIEWNETRTLYPRAASIPELFAECVRETPGAPALEFDGTTWPYSLLDRRSNQIANRLLREGCAQGSLIGVCMQRSAAMVSVTLGILKAGCAYVPLDAAYPAERLRFMLADTGVQVVIADPASTVLIQCAGGRRLISADADWHVFAGERDERPELEIRADDPAYVMYTSGSTGKPKGIVIPHRAIVRLVRNTDYVHLDATDRIAQVSNISFDAATFEIWGALLNGACLVGIDKDTVLVPESFAAALRERRITTMFVTSALFSQMAREAPDGFRFMRNLLVGGEAVDPGAVRSVQSAGAPARLINAYGPTESTTFACCHEIGPLPQDAINVPIGRPIANTAIYILDQNRLPVPLGVPGELHIGGDGLASDYLNRPELNLEKFILNPFSNNSDARLYRTGDLVRYRRDGAVEFLGRLDQQVKIRGFRIEPAEIDAALLGNPDLRQSITLVREDTPGEKRLVSYCVPAEGRAPAATDLRQFLAERLPEYMLPAAFVLLDEMPINANGKTDRALLPPPGSQRAELSDRFVAPRSSLETTLARIWEELLAEGKIGVEDNFFEIGGHSLMATQVASRIRDELGIEVPLRVFFEHQTVSALARQLADQASTVDRTERIRPRENQDAPAPLSYPQQRLWFLDQLNPGNALYNVPAVVRLQGDLNVAALEQALSQVVNRHEALRTHFSMGDEGPVQKIGPATGLALSHVAGHVDEVSGLARAEAGRPFDLSNGPLIRAALVQTGDAEHVLLLTIHHTICDGWSIGILIREAAAVYQSIACGGDADLPNLPLQYADFAVWQRESSSGEALNSKLEYWKSRLGGELPVLELPSDRPRTPNPSLRGAKYQIELKPELLESLKAVSAKCGATLFMTLLAAFKTLLARYTGQHDVVIGSPIAGRTRAELEGLIGLFVNTLVLRTDLSGDPAFTQLLDRVRETTLGAYANQDVPFETLVNAIAPERTRSRNPLFQVAFVLQNAPAPPLELPGLVVDVRESDAGTSKFDLTLVAQELAGGLSLSFEYSVDLFDERTMERMAEHLTTLLESIAADPTRRISDLPVMREAEQRLLIDEWNRTNAPFPHGLCLDALFLEQVERTPEAVAVSFGDEALTYAELNSRANRVAAALRSRGVGREVLVGIALERSPELIVAILGVLKAGGAWLPLAVDQPAERLTFLLNDARPKVVVGNAQSIARLPGMAQDFDLLDLDDPRLENLNDDNVASTARPGNLAYVIYTSGSTGRPKGVLIEHRGAVNLAVAQAKLFGVSAGTRVLQFAAVTFDAAVSEVFVTLFSGGTLVMPRREQLLGPDLAELLRESEVNVVTLPPSVLATLPEAGLPCLRTLVVAGEACPIDLARRWSAARRMINAYGPTEATVCATAGECEGHGRMTIGRPIDNVRVYIVDSNLRPAPLGVPGELLIGGAGVARGYLARPELTEEKFIADPFIKGARLYRTGDRARYLADGRIEYLGRMDRQVKIRGFRIEPGEIEAALTELETVREAVVIDREDSPGHRRLVAYVTPRDLANIRSSDLRSKLEQVLPGYMIPAAFVVLNTLPLTAHGKIDRAGLPAPDTDRTEPGQSYAAPRNTLEQTLAEIWQQILGVGQVGIHDSFFELGGDSILTIQVVARAHQAGLRLTPRDLFDHQTIAALAAVVEESPATECEQGAVTGPVALTPIQHWFFEQQLDGVHHWNQSVLLKLSESPDVIALQSALVALDEHHDALRLRFAQTGSGWTQEITAPGAAPPLGTIDLSGYAPNERAAAMEHFATEAQASLDLIRGPLFRAVLFNLGDEGWRLLLVIHHLATDGVSWRILLEDLHASYLQLRAGNSVQLPRKTTSFRQWAERLAGSADSAQVLGQADYWLSAASAPYQMLPVDAAATSEENSRASCDSVSVRLDETETAQLLREVPKAYRTRINDVLLTALARAFRPWTGNRSLLIDMESHGRDALGEVAGSGVDLSRTVGWFTSAWPLQLELPPGNDLGESLKTIKENLRRVPHNGTGYGILRYLAGGDIGRRLASAPSPEISFNYLGQFDQSFAQATAFSMADEARGQELSPRGRRRNLLEFNGNISGGQLHFTCVYSQPIHHRATIERLLGDFAGELRALIAHCVSTDVGGVTPSDFPLAQLDAAKLGKLARLIARPPQGRT